MAVELERNVNEELHVKGKFSGAGKKPERVLSNISYTRSVSSDIQTLRSELKNEAIAEFFDQLRGVWISDETRLSSV